jgi:putative redox protein
VVTGKGLDSAKVARAISLSADVYCSASAMLAKTANITHDFELIEG